jgi:hypothetical protein
LKRCLQPLLARNNRIGDAMKMKDDVPTMMPYITV